MRSQTVLDWIAAAMHCGPAGQRARLIHARGFLRHLKAGFPETEVPPSGILAPVIRPKPYLYTPEETAGLLQATHLLWPSGSLQQLTPYTLIGLLASTGLRPGESIHLALADVRLDTVPSHLEVRHTKFYKSRLAPLRPTTVEQLRRYRVERNGTGAPGPPAETMAEGMRLLPMPTALEPGSIGESITCSQNPNTKRSQNPNTAAPRSTRARPIRSFWTGACR